MPTRDEFIATLLPTARKYERLYGIAAEAFIAVNISETNWGAAGSLFGIKGSGTAGSITYTTWENYGPGKEYTVIDDSFAVYATVDDAYADFIRFIQIGRYIPAWTEFQRTKDWRELLRGINRAGYATDPGWADMIIALTETVKKSPAWTAAAQEEIMQRYNAVAPSLDGVSITPGANPTPVSLKAFTPPVPAGARMLRVEVYAAPPATGGEPELQVLDGDGAYAGQTGWGRGQQDAYTICDVLVQGGQFFLRGAATVARIGAVGYW